MSHYRVVLGRLPAIAVVMLAAMVQLVARCASAHELEMDTLSVRVGTASAEVAGQLLLDPDKTRPGWNSSDEEAATPENERARLLSFVEDHVFLQVGNEPLDVAFDVRELYVRGGAVPGDSVVYRATLPAGWRRLALRIKNPLDQVAVTTTVDGNAQPTDLVSGEQPFVLHEVENGAATPSSANSTGTSRSIVSESIGHVWTGVVHIVPLGWDHILFVVALTLGSLGRWRRLVPELSAFTVAHTFTLALGSLEIVQLAPAVVEPLIALSIAAVALEHVFDLQKASVRYGLVAFFGLLHGLGFAGALLGLGFSGGSFLLFLASFNIGVELGQLAVVGATLAGFWCLARWPKVLKVAPRALALVIAACGLVVGTARVFEPRDPVDIALTPAPAMPVAASSSMTRH